MTLRPFSAAPLALAAAALAACAAPEGEPSEAAPAETAQSGIAAECPTRTAIWQNPKPSSTDGVCPRVPDTNQDDRIWTGQPVFTAGPSAAAYCKYTWGDPQTPPDFDELSRGLNPDAVPSLEPGRDCPAVASLGSPSEEPAVWQPLRDQYWRHAGRAAGPLPPVKDLVRVAVLDTSKTPYTDLSTPYDVADDHGRLVGRAIGDLACPGAFDGQSGCAVEIVNYPALARKDERSAPVWDKGPPEGGYYGSLGELAEAIEHALDDWNTARAEHGPNRLVLNLSVGWSPVFGGALVVKPGQAPNPAKLPPAARPVYDALARASCAGATIIAAAGNYDLAGGTGLMYPAAWESVPAPSAEVCRRNYPLESKGALDLPVFPPFGASAYRPLVHAAGVVDERDQPIGISRQGGQPRLAAYGVGVVTDEPRTGRATRIKTGTSFAAATASGAAGLAWAFRPDLRPDELMELVYKSGPAIAPSVDVTPDLCAGASCAPWGTRRISACAAGALAHCGAEACDDLRCDPVPAFGGEPAPASVSWGNFGFPPEKLSTPGACSGGPACMAWAGDTTLGTPWVGPQPGGGGCDTCAYSGSQSKVVIGLDDYARHCAYAVSASVEKADGTTEVYDVTPPAASFAPDPSSLAAQAVPGPPPPPFKNGIFEVPLPVEPSKVRSVTLWFNTTDGEHPGGAYTRAEGIPTVK